MSQLTKNIYLLALFCVLIRFTTTLGRQTDSIDFFSTTILYLLTFASLILAINKHKFIFSLVAAVLFGCFYVQTNSFGKWNHNLNFLVMAVLLQTLNFYKPKQNLIHNNEANSDPLSGAFLIAYMTSSYFLGGLWKLYLLTRTIPALDAISTVKEHLAYMRAEGNGPSLLIEQVFSQNWWLLGFGYFLVICLQLLSPFVIWYPNKIKYWALLMIGFHFMNGIFFNIWFVENIALLSIIAIEHRDKRLLVLPDQERVC